ncbi:MAG: amidohydrolase family protein [Inquilinaceae bacterium]
MPEPLPTADLIVSGGHVLTINPVWEVFERGCVVVDAGRIVAVGPAELAQSWRPRRAIDATGRFVLPGMVNGHTHAAMTLFRGLGDDRADRLERFIWPLEANSLDRGAVRDGARLGIAEMALGGVTCFADMYFFEAEVARTAAEIGLRCIAGQTVLGSRAPDAAGPDDALALAGQLIADWRDHALVAPAIAPHAPHTLDHATWERVAALAAAEAVPVLTHLAETTAETAAIADRAGVSPTAYLDRLGLLTPRLVAGHCIFVGPDDIALLAARGAGVIHNMAANLKSAKGIAPAPALVAAGAKVGLGTDGPMSGNTLDVIGQLGLVAKVHKYAAGDRTIMPARDVLRMASMGGAEALGMGDRIGSLEPGKRADLVLIDATGLHLAPVYDPYAALVYGATPLDVRTVFVDGKPVVEERRLVSVDADAVRKAVEGRRTAILDRVPD